MHFSKLSSFGTLFILGSHLLLGATATPPATPREAIAGDALINEGGYHLLKEMSDRMGPRMIGTSEHAMSLDFLEAELNALGIQTRRQDFEFPGWIRGKAEVSLLEPMQREIRAVALGYTGTFLDVTGSLVYVDNRDFEKLDLEALRGKVLLLRQNLTFTTEELETLAEDYNVKGALLTNRLGGGQVLARTANHHGIPTPFPMFSITQEEGLWMMRKLQSGENLEIRLSTTSQNEKMKATNLIATLPGRSDEKILLGGHFDSWDLGQGAMDNGLGVAQVFEAARLLKAHSPGNEHTVEFIWFDAEEFGLWGARYYAEVADLDPVRAMVNLDMVGEPIAINAMGFDGLVPVLEAYQERLGGWSFSRRVANKPWIGSDHHPFIMKGVPSITFNAPIDADDVRYYHDMADTFDKVDRETLARASAIITLLIYDLANDTEPRVPRLSEEATAQLFRDAGLEDRMRRRGGWPFGEAESGD